MLIESPCPGPGCKSPETLEPTALGPRIVYLNFEGVTLTSANNTDNATTDTSYIISATTAPGSTLYIPAFSPSDLGSTGGLSRDQIISRVIDRLYASHQAFDVHFVTARPTSGPYSMVVIGGDCETVAGASCAGVALLDCGDSNPVNISFVFPPGLRVDDLATTAAQESAHAFGLAHTDDTDDIMYPIIRQSIPSSFGAGSLPPGDRSCGGVSFQDSHQLMLSTIGPRGQELLPAVVIEQPQSGAVVYPGDVVAGSATDTSAVTEVSLVIGGETVAVASQSPYSFVVPDTTVKGDVELAVRALDDEGNVGAAAISVYIAGPDDIPCSDGACPGDLICVSDICIDRADGGLGSFCSTNSECDSGICAERDGEQRCSTSCDAATPCPAGFECIGDTACWPADPGSSSFLGLCSASGGGTGGWLLILIALVAARRGTACLTAAIDPGRSGSARGSGPGPR